MSLKLKPTGEKLWTEPQDPLYDLPIETIRGLVWPEPPTLKMSIHPGWLSLMDQLEVGDVVVITKVFEITSLGMRKYEVLIGNKKEVFFSMSLKKIEDNKSE